MKKYIALLIIPLLVSCKNVKLSQKHFEYESDEYIIKTDVAVVEKNDDFAKQINSDAQKYNDEQIADFRTRLDKDFCKTQKSSLNITITPTYCDNKFISYCSNKKMVLSDLGERIWRSSKNMDLSLGKVLVLSDLFSDNEYVDFLNARIDDVLNNDSENYGELWKRPRIEKRSQTDFYIKKGYLVLYYQPYDLSYYAKGVVELPIEITDLRGYMKEEYYNNFK